MPSKGRTHSGFFLSSVLASNKLVGRVVLPGCDCAGVDPFLLGRVGCASRSQATSESVDERSSQIPCRCESRVRKTGLWRKKHCETVRQLAVTMYPGTRLKQFVLACLASVAICQGQGIITTVAGSDLVYPGSSFSALSASFGQLTGVAVSPVTGDVYFASSSRSLIVKFNPQLNSVSVVAGIGIGGYSGDGGPAANAALNSPQQLAFDAAD
jgi:hypothetical protein